MGDYTLFYLKFLNSEEDYGWFPLAYKYFGWGREGEEKGKKEGKEEGKEKKKGKEGKAGRVLRKGKKDKGEDKKKGKGGGKK